MNAVSKIEPQAPAVVSETTAIIAMIERAARDPEVNIDKMRQLLEMRATIEAQASRRAFNSAMSKSQAEMRPVAADCHNPSTKSRYASYLAIDGALRPIYTKHGFALSFGTADGAPDQYVRLTCVVSHDDGHERNYHIDMPADGKGAKGGDVMTKTHATGSAVTYGQRYLLKLIFNIAVGADDDGNAAAGGAQITADQVVAIRDLIESTGADIQKFCGYFKIDGVAKLPAKQYGRAVAMLNQKGAEK